MVQSEDPRVRVFWQRVAAITVDFAFWGVIGFGVMILWRDRLSVLGPYGRLIGFFLHATYFGVMNSKMCRGQTLGKRLLGIHVTDARGSYLTPARATARALLMLLPFYLNYWPVLERNVLLGYVGAIIIFGFLPADYYFILFNRRTRQTFHDLVVGSFVTKASQAPEPISAQPIWKGHYAIYAALLAVIGGAGAFYSLHSDAARYSTDLKIARDAASSIPGVNTVSIMLTWARTPRYPIPIEGVVATLYTFKEPANDEHLAQQAAQVILAKLPEAKQRMFLHVSIMHQFNIGIFSLNKTYNFQHSPKDWLARSPANTSPSTH